jgi:uncharacterized protein (TIGR00297 family)
MTGPARHSEAARQSVHIAMGAVALLLRWTPWWAAVTLAAAALTFNVVVLPRIGGLLYRPADHGRPLHGIIFYPVAVLMLLLAFPRRPDIVAAAWGILAVGDGVATLAGRALGGPRWPWSRDKTISGSTAFVIAGAAAGVFLAWWCRPALDVPPSMAFTFFAPVAGSLIAALVETIPVRLDDNLSVAAAAGAVLWLASLISGDRLSEALSVSTARLGPAVALNAAVAWLGYLAHTVRFSGALTGAVIGILIYAGLGWRGWTLLLITFIAASGASRMGLTRKRLLGVAEEKEGRRGAGNAMANTGVAAIAAVIALMSTHSDAARLAFAAALTAGGSDTIASEIGKAFGRRTWSVSSFARVPPGTSGAMSIEGTLAGVLGAIGLGGAAAGLGVVPGAALGPIVLGATAGSLLESWLGATLEAPGILNNDMLNFINTAAAALVAVALGAALP